MRSMTVSRFFVLIFAALLLICLFGTSAFAETGALILPASLKQVEAQAFYNDSSIQSIVIPDGASSIGDEAFSGCVNLTEITIPESVISIGDNAFSGCGDLTIRCHSDSYAAAYAQSHGIDLSYTDVSDNHLICVSSIRNFDPDSDSLNRFDWPTFATLKLPANVQLADDDSMLLTAGRLDDNSANTVSVNALYNNTTKQINAYLFNVEYASLSGDITVRVYCSIYNAQNVCTFSDSMDFTISFGAALSNPPTGIQVPQASYQLQTGETLRLKTSDIQPADGDLGDFDCVRTYDLESCIADNGNLVYQNDAYLNIAFQNPGSYVVYAQLSCAGYKWETPISIVVGDDPYAAASLSFDLLYNYFYLTHDYDDSYIWLGNGSWNGLGDTSDKWVKLTVAPEAAGQPDLGIFYPSSYTSSQNQNFEICLPNASDCAPGNYAYNITLDLIDASGNTLFTQTIPFTLKLLETPENLPTGIQAKQTTYNIQPGDTLRIDNSDIEFIGGALPEGVTPQYSIGWPGQVTCSVDDSGFNLFFPRAGSYIIDLFATINNLSYSTTTSVNVGSAAAMDLQPSFSQYVQTVYIDGTESDGEYDSIASVSFWNLPEDFDHADWTLTPITAGENALDLYISGSYDDNSGVFISANHSPETAAGRVVYRCAYTLYDAADNAIATGSRDITVDCVKVDAPLPTGFDLPYEDTIFLNLGDSFTVDYDQIVFTGNALPDGVKPRYSHAFDDNFGRYIRSQNNHRTEYVFNEPCRNTLHVWAKIGDKRLQKDLNIVVANGVPRSAYMYVDQWTQTAFVGKDDIDRILYARLENFTLLPDEHLYWDVKRLSDDTNPGQIAVYYNDISDDDYAMGEVYLTHLEEAVEGTLEYRLNCHVFDGNDQEIAVYSKPIRVELQATPDNLPTALTLPQDEYHFNAGETHEFLYSDIGFADGEVPDDAVVSFDYYIDSEYCSVNWMDDGISVQFDNSGRYKITTAARINNLYIYKDIRVSVESQGIASPIMTFDEYVYSQPLSDNASLGAHFLSARIRAWDFIQDGETTEWTITELDANGNPPDLKLQNYGSSTWANVSTSGATRANTGDRSFRLTFTAKDAQGNIIAQTSKDFRASFSTNGTLYEISCAEIG